MRRLGDLGRSISWGKCCSVFICNLSGEKCFTYFTFLRLMSQRKIALIRSHNFGLLRLGSNLENEPHKEKTVDESFGDGRSGQNLGLLFGVVLGLWVFVVSGLLGWMGFLVCPIYS